MKKKLNIKFLDFEPYFPQRQHMLWDLISRHYEICETDNPDYLLDRGVSLRHHQYVDCVKILFVNENVTADFNSFDYAVGFDDLSFGDRYIRHPLFARYPKFDQLVNLRPRSDEELINRKFCSFVVSNSDLCDPIRRKFFDRLSKYKRVDSGGRYLNNVGGPVKDKIDFCRGYKFNIAFENSSSPGYTTEKIMEAYAAESVPIYYGNPTIETDFRLESMVRVTSENDIERAVEEVIRLDNDDAAYLAKCHEHSLAVPDPTVYERELEAFLVSIFEQPIGQARRRNRYGCQAMMQEHMRKLMKLDQWIGKVRQVLHV